MATKLTKRKFIDFARNTNYFSLSEKRTSGEIVKYA
jgi:hypothetical protein